MTVDHLNRLITFGYDIITVFVQIVVFFAKFLTGTVFDHVPFERTAHHDLCKLRIGLSLCIHLRYCLLH